MYLFPENTYKLPTLCPGFKKILKNEAGFPRQWYFWHISQIVSWLRFILVTHQSISDLWSFLRFVKLQL